jgi:hypothetical protein
MQRGPAGSGGSMNKLGANEASKTLMELENNQRWVRTYVRRHLR